MLRQVNITLYYIQVHTQKFFIKIASVELVISLAFEEKFNVYKILPCRWSPFVFQRSVFMVGLGLSGWTDIQGPY